MRGRIGHVMWRRAAYWAPAVVAAALLVGGIAAVWTHGLPARAGVGSRQTTAATAPGSWARLADTPDPYAYPLLLLPTGKVLMPYSFGATSAAIYDPATNTWGQTSPFSESLSTNVVLLHNEMVFFAGNGSSATDAEIYDPLHDAWKIAGSLNISAWGNGLVTMQDGRVLAMAGYGAISGGHGPISSAEIYDPTTDKWTVVASMAQARIDPTTVALPDGRVFVVGGWTFPGASGTRVAPGGPLCGTAGCPVGVSSAEVYDPSKNSWTSAGSLPDDRGGYTATLLPTGDVLIAGGLVGGVSSTLPAATNLLYNPSTNSWSQAATMIHQRGDHVAALMPTGQVLVAGGVDRAQGTSTEVYDPTANTWTAAPNLPVYHIEAVAVVLPDGRFIVSGGNQGPGCCAFVPDTSTARSFAPRGSGPTYEVDAFSTVPGLPADVKATAGNNAATVTWTAATPDGSPISGYTVTASPGGKSATVPGTATSATVGGLSGGASYTFTVAATNGFGAGPHSAPSNAVTPAGPSLTPTPTSPPATPTDTPSGGTGSGPTAQTSATPTPTSAPAATDTPTPQTSANNPPPGPSKANRSTGGSPPFLLLGLLVLVILLLGGGAVYLFARRGGSGT